MNGKKQLSGVRYHLDNGGCFVIEDYNRSKTFTNFFPGVSGIWGIPMWVFYVNRGQGISSFGIEGKDKAILEFQPANKAYRLTALQGFRTFVKVRSGGRTKFWEPFQARSGDDPSRVRQKMIITAHDLTIEEVHRPLGLVARVNYFTLPEEDFPALVRRLTVRNISGKTCAVELIDGLPMIMPYGLSDWVIKNMSRTVEAWTQVDNLKNRAPYFHLNVEVSDTPEVKHVTEGNFYFAFEADSPRKGLLDPIVDGKSVFGSSTDFLSPERFLAPGRYVVPQAQQTSNRTPCAMCLDRFSLSPGKEKTIHSFVGYAYSEKKLARIVKKVIARGFVAAKARQNRDITAGIQDYAFTNSASREFNLYAGQTFLDNVLRGGLPVSLKTGEGNVAFNVFSRKHGDPERDYNYFVLSPTHFSQGNGNYRDVNQNRRNDVWFNKDVQDNGIIDFLSLIQADGYNPLLVKGLSFYIEDGKKIDAILSGCIEGDSHLVRERLQTDFHPGELLNLVSHNGIRLRVSPQEFLGRVLGACRKHLLAEHVEGYWSDHWTYNLDLIESYLALYPESLRALLLEKENFSFFHSTHFVLPREQRYILTDEGVRQYHAIKDEVRHPGTEVDGHKLRTKGGQGEVYYTCLLIKLLCVIANKAATLDPSGIGIEMEGGKPNWYDALNGLPGLLGSSLSETLELKRFCLFLQESLGQLALDDSYQIPAFAELAAFIRDLNGILREEKAPELYWHRANDVKEQYRLRVRKGIDGREENISAGEIREFLERIMTRADHAVRRAAGSDGLVATYFRHEVRDYALLNRTDDGHSYVLPIKFRKQALPPFLEGFVHALRVERDPVRAQRLYHRVKKSPLYDKKLRMYKANADLTGESEEIGRTRIFPRGWLENESIWLHMEYKYLLELLRCGLYPEFYETFRETLIPFLKPKQYGRSTLENSSFLVSSAHEDETLHGRGFVARLSGSTAEFVHIWLMMNAGQKPFFLGPENKVCLSFQPALPGWLFTEKATRIEYTTPKGKRETLSFPKDTYAFKFLGNTLVVYHNPKRRDTFGKRRCVIKKMVLSYPQRRRPLVILGDTIPHEPARDVRDNRVERIDVFLE